jgi:hypothetical protein
MTTRHPFSWMGIQVQKVAFWPLLAFALLMMAVQQSLGGPLITAAAPSGIVSFELAGSLAGARPRLCDTQIPDRRPWPALRSSRGNDLVSRHRHSVKETP